MREPRLRTDLKRAVTNGFAWPLGFDPGPTPPPTQGYTVTYGAGEEDEPDTYAFSVVVSHERLGPIVRAAFERFLPEEVCPILEADSCDAYRRLDVYMGEDVIPLQRFLRVWERYEPFLLEESALAGGANSDDPFVEVFVDQWKGVVIHVPLSMREEVETMLAGFGLEEVAQTWPAEGEGATSTAIRPVLEVVDDDSTDFDELLVNLRREWQLQLSIDPDTNVDEGGRDLGLTLWHAVVLVASVADDERATYADVWATAGSLNEMQDLLIARLDGSEEWLFDEVYTIDRIAYDDRPDALADVAVRPDRAEVLLVNILPEAPPEAGGAADAASDAPRQDGPRA